VLSRSIAALPDEQRYQGPLAAREVAQHIGFEEEFPRKGSSRGVSNSPRFNSTVACSCLPRRRPAPNAQSFRLKSSRICWRTAVALDRLKLSRDISLQFFMSNALKHINSYREMAQETHAACEIADAVAATYLGAVEAGAGQKTAPELIAFLADSG
jgi:hypothetical protein